jgi:hypothetical protein
MSTRDRSLSFAPNRGTVWSCVFSRVEQSHMLAAMVMIYCRYWQSGDHTAHAREQFGRICKPRVQVCDQAPMGKSLLRCFRAKVSGRPGRQQGTLD